ncbi:MAG: hypothetical protein ABJB03_11580 [Rhodoglobus sp.]
MTPAERRAQLERNATALFIGTSLVMAIVFGAIIISGWFAGVLVDSAERVFWAGALLSGLIVPAFAGAAFPGGADDARQIRRVTWLTRIGLVLFVVSPALCIGALVADFYR